MGFLDKLRMNNIFPRNPGTDTPFGMPEIDDGNVGAMLGTAANYARNANDDDMNRQKNMMQFEFDLKNKQNRRPLDMRAAAIGDTSPRPGMTQARQGAPTSGFSPMQQQFRQDDLAAKARQQEQSDLSAKFQQAMQMQQEKQSGDIDLQALRGEQETGQIAQRDAGAQNAAALRMQFDRETAGTKSAADIAAARTQHTNAMALGVQRGDQDRLTNSQKPPVGAAADPIKQFAERAQGLAIEAPALATMLVPPTESGGQFTISPKATPDQIVAIRKYMMGQQAAPAAPAKPKSKVVTSPSKASIVDRTNQVSRR